MGRFLEFMRAVLQGVLIAATSIVLVTIVVTVTALVVLGGWRLIEAAS